MVNTNTKTKKTKRIMNEYVRFVLMMALLLMVVFLSVQTLSTETKNDSSSATVEETVTPPTVIEPIEQPKEDVLTCSFRPANSITTCGGVMEEEIFLTVEYLKGKKEEDFFYVTEEYSLTEEEYLELCKLTFAESGRKSEKEMISIASVVLKRSKEEGFEDSVKGVILEEGQFSTVKNGEVHWFIEADVEIPVKEQDIIPEVYECVNRALEGEDPTEVMVTDGAIYFYSEKYISDAEMEKRKNIKEKIKFGDTVFYRSLN